MQHIPLSSQSLIDHSTFFNYSLFNPVLISENCGHGKMKGMDYGEDRKNVFGLEVDDEDFHGKLHKAYFFTSLAGIAVVAGLFFFAAVVEYLARTKAPFGGFPLLSGIKGLQYILYGIAVALIFLIHRTGRGQHLFPSYNTIMPGREISGRVRLGRLVKKAVISYVLCEAVAVTGLVLFSLSGSRRDFYALLGISLLSVILCFPKFRDWLTFVTEEQRPRWSMEK